jgi:flagellar motor switch protein FliN/FliY
MAPPPETVETVSNELKDLLDPAEIDALLKQHGSGTAVAEPQPFEFQSFDPQIVAVESPDQSTQLDREQEFELQIEFGRASVPLEDIPGLCEGSVVPLDKLAGDPVDIRIGDRLVARGEVLVLQDKFCVRIAEILMSPGFDFSTNSPAPA